MSLFWRKLTPKTSGTDRSSGLHPGNAVLYVSTGGFSGDARRKADRANTPNTLVDLDCLAALLTQYYESYDADTRTPAPMRKVWRPV